MKLSNLTIWDNFIIEAGFKLIEREYKKTLISYFKSDQNKGLILSGIVGCGKTTLIDSCLEVLKSTYAIFKFTGDDTVFRNDIQMDSKYLYEHIRGQTQKRILIFIDEIQKCEDIFDALKFIFDKGNASFIVSGSNPLYLQTVAKKRLQRRADFKILPPLSLPELIKDAENINISDTLDELLSGNFNIDLPQTKLTPKIKFLTKKYLLRGGLPLSYLAPDDSSALLEVQKTFDRGFYLIRSETHSFSDSVAVELSLLHSKEFTYANIINKTRVRNRSLINEVIEALVSHGYLGCVLPFLFEENKRSYLKKYFYIDSGLVTYLSGYKEISRDLGYKVEGIVYSRLLNRLQFQLTKNKGLYFYKNYSLKSDGSLRFSKGEVDAIYQSGELIIPIEIKTNENWTSIDTEPLSNFLEDKKLKFGLVIYGGVPMRKKNIVFWPYWLL